MKTVLVQISGAGQTVEPRKVLLEPGSTARDVLAGLGLEGYSLSRLDGQIFAADEEVYELVEDGQALQATVKATVGAGEER